MAAVSVTDARARHACTMRVQPPFTAASAGARSIAEDIVGSGENWITELSDDELHEMFALHKNAVRD